jgi:DMSO/TMAO reductase YedYZ heme-binding membrane subunit
MPTVGNYVSLFRDHLAITALGFAVIHATAWMARLMLRTLPSEFRSAADEDMIRLYVRISTFAVLVFCLVGIVGSLVVSLLHAGGGAGSP